MPEIKTFEDFKLNRQLLNAVSDAGYETPTAIQLQAIPQVLAGHDVLGIAQTGTGKTAAYLLPLLMKLKYAQGQNPRALILAPTRELAMQIGESASQLAQYTDLRHAVVFGGIGPKSQKEEIAKGIDLLIATPGRMLDIYMQGELILKEIKTLILDEADKMMDMGFMPQIRKVLEIIPRKRQNLLFSATMPEKVVRLSEEFLEFPVRVEVAPQSTTADMVNQVLYEVPNLKTKINLLAMLLLDQENFNRVIVFTRTKEIANNIFKFLSRKVLAANDIRVIHANKGQNSRINAMEAFKEGNVRVLVATDVAARGIDVSEVSHVINFDVPIIYEDYVHRIGRTGRANHPGEAITFMTEAEVNHIEKIEEIIRLSIQRKAVPDDLIIEETSFDESQEMAKAIDDQRKKADPTFKGAFHDKKKQPTDQTQANLHKPVRRRTHGSSAGKIIRRRK
jgi:ATP-dependent RNA helicase RhlE